MSQKEEMLSVAEVCELVPGDENKPTWINHGFRGVAREITQKTTKAGKPFWPCVIGDETGSSKIEVSFFTAPKFREGDVIELVGSGLRRTEYNGKAQAAISQKTTVHVIGKSVHHEEQQQRAAASDPAVNGEKQRINGQTVGMAVKEAISLVAKSEVSGSMTSPEFWESVHRIASQIIRASCFLEAGNLAPKIGAPNPPATTTKPNTPPASTVRKSQPTEAQQANLTGPDEDVAF